MELKDEHNFSFLEREFDFPGSVQSITSLGSGHIHDTYLVTCGNGEQSRFVLQKFNHQVFKHPRQVAANIQMVNDCFDSSTSTELQPIKLVNTLAGDSLYESPLGEYWRVFNYIENSDSFDKVNNTEQALGAATAFGSFIEMMRGLDPKDLYTTIPDFHNLKLRFDQLRTAISKDEAHRASEHSSDIDFALQRSSKVIQYSDLAGKEKIPLRVTHNDTKINNVLFLKGTTQAISVIDLDTVMPGLLLYDFGDMARTFCNSVLEEDNALDVSFRLNIFEALCKGFFDGLKTSLPRAEVDSLKAGPWWMTYIMGIRFFADFLNGDVYYKISYPQQNLDRARNQFRLVADIEEKQREINQIIESHYS